MTRYNLVALLFVSVYVGSLAGCGSKVIRVTVREDAGDQEGDSAVGEAGVGGQEESGGTGGTGGAGGFGGTGGFVPTGGTGGAAGAAPGQLPCGSCASLDSINTLTTLIGITLTECCVTAKNVCGTSFGAGDCTERDQPGTPNAACPTESPASLYGFVSLAGCCKPGGRCGVDASILLFGCVAREDIPAALGLGTFAAMPCTYTP